MCDRCSKQEFKENGVAKTRGIVFYKCDSCSEPSANFAHAQHRVCHACADHLGNCEFCGRPV